MKQMLIIGFIVLLKVNVLYAQIVLNLDMFDGTEQSIGLTMGSCITFRADSVVVIPRVGNYDTTVYATLSIRKMSFSESIITEVDTEKQSKIMVYPNPVADYLVIEDVWKENIPLTVYSLDGSVVIRGRYRYGSCVDVSFLAPGPYLIQVGECNCKFVKK